MSNLDYVIEPASEGGYYVYFSCNTQGKTYAATLGEALDTLIENINGYVEGMYLVEEYN